jgi:hypothetical protein
MGKQDRGAEAQRLIDNPMFLEALSATREWAMDSFRNAKTPNEAFEAKMICEAASVFGAHLIAVVKVGEAAVKAIVREREKPRRMFNSKANVKSMEQYLTDAAEARARYAGRGA